MSHGAYSTAERGSKNIGYDGVAVDTDPTDCSQEEVCMRAVINMFWPLVFFWFFVLLKRCLKSRIGL